MDEQNESIQISSEGNSLREVFQSEFTDNRHLYLLFEKAKRHIPRCWAVLGGVYCYVNDEAYINDWPVLYDSKDHIWQCQSFPPDWRFGPHFALDLSNDEPLRFDESVTDAFNLLGLQMLRLLTPLRSGQLVARGRSKPGEKAQELDRSIWDEEDVWLNYVTNELAQWRIGEPRTPLYRDITLHRKRRGRKRGQKRVINEDASIEILLGILRSNPPEIYRGRDYNVSEITRRVQEKLQEKGIKTIDDSKMRAYVTKWMRDFNHIN